ncbi:hypothetical protein GOBAR_AA36794 [Gossypium barbadense]|uniref:Uncharacterized protein n=1 Tax=Gossypium barbadense TaxID=3634 RepID=A0A2P5VYK4_GOSBA|nr:hypothetical protein GOBAR_DD28412 [Gossypium barbadense]PPR83922.1 hypothetical protein GOBAR_AA36794 [Gossypium barbadense]
MRCPPPATSGAGIGVDGAFFDSSPLLRFSSYVGSAGSFVVEQIAYTSFAPQPFPQVPFQFFPPPLPLAFNLSKLSQTLYDPRTLFHLVLEELQEALHQDQVHGHLMSSVSKVCSFNCI